LVNAGRVDEAGNQADRAAQVAAASGSPELLARARVLKARHLWGTGKDLEGAYLLLRQAEPALLPNGPYPAQKDCLTSLADLSLDLGRYAEGLETFQRLAELAAAKQDPNTESMARYGMARAVFDQTAELPSPEGRSKIARMAQQALAPATAAQNQDVLAKAHLILGILSEGTAARDHLAACMAAAGSARNQSYCLNALARLVSLKDPGEA